MAGSVMEFHPHSFCNPSDHRVVPLGIQEAALPGRGRFIIRLKLPSTLNIADVEAPVNIHHVPNTTYGKGKIVDGGSSSMGALAVRNTDTGPVLAIQKQKIAEEGAVPFMQAERKRHIIRLKVVPTKNTTTKPEVKKNQELAETLKSPDNVVGSTSVKTCISSPNRKVVHHRQMQDKYEDKFEASKRKLEEQYKGIQDSRKKIRVIELKDLPKQGTRLGAPAPLTKKRMMKTKYGRRC